MSRKDVDPVWRSPKVAKQANYNAHLLAKMFNICPRHLRRYTHKLFHCSPQHWLDEQRLKDAIVMLETEGLIKAVAFDLGFKSVSHFSHKFKSRYGISPKKFQEQVKFKYRASLLMSAPSNTL